MIRYSPAGFVLLEVLVSVAILSVGIAVLLQSIISSLDANRLTLEYSKAMFLAESRMWELEREYAFQEGMATGTSYGDFDPPSHAYSWKSEIESVDRAAEYRIQLTIEWMHRGQEQAYTLHTLVPMKRTREDLKT